MNDVAQYLPRRSTPILDLLCALQGRVRQSWRLSRARGFLYTYMKAASTGRLPLATLRRSPRRLSIAYYRPRSMASSPATTLCDKLIVCSQISIRRRQLSIWFTIPCNKEKVNNRPAHLHYCLTDLAVTSNLVKYQPNINRVCELRAANEP